MPFSPSPATCACKGSGWTKAPGLPRACPYHNPDAHKARALAAQAEWASILARGLESLTATGWRFDYHARTRKPHTPASRALSLARLIRDEQQGGWE